MRLSEERYISLLTDFGSNKSYENMKTASRLTEI